MKVEDEPNTPNIKKFIYEIFQSNTRVKIVKHRKKIEMQLEKKFFSEAPCIYAYIYIASVKLNLKLGGWTMLKSCDWLLGWKVGCSFSHHPFLEC